MQKFIIVFAITYYAQLVISQNACPEYHKDYKGGDISINGTLGAFSALECQEKCQENDLCRFWTWGTASHPNINVSNICYLKNIKNNVTENNFTISGPKNCQGINVMIQSQLPSVCFFRCRLKGVRSQSGMGNWCGRLQ